MPARNPIFDIASLRLPAHVLGRQLKFLLQIWRIAALRHDASGVAAAGTEGRHQGRSGLSPSLVHAILDAGRGGASRVLPLAREPAPVRNPVWRRRSLRRA